MSNPRIEEVDSDVSDPEEMDLDAFDFARPGQTTLAPTTNPSQSQMDPAMLQQMLGQQQQQAPQQMNEKERLRREQEAKERTKMYQCLYPVYFDASRSREEGRRVSKEDAVSNPLAREIVEALQHIGNSKNIPLQVVFEPSKTHPKDWANPGRVRVLIKKDGKAVSAKVANKHHLYKLVSEFLKAHPTTEDTPLKMPIRGMPPPKDKIPPPAIPRGFKIGKILPLHSPALSGGGVSDNMMQDMMKELQGAGGGAGGMPDMSALMAGMGGAAGGGSGGGQKKEKKKR